MAILKRYAGKKLKKSQFPASTAKVGLLRIGLKPIVLHRQPSRNQTVIEKLEKESDGVGFAFVLLTPDDIAYPADQSDWDDNKRDKEPRARQNVALEFGFFVGKLGRSRVCCLYKEGVALPSDIKGIVYIELKSDIDSEGLSIITELQAAGYEVKLPGKPNS
jgi:predicted nucleotide-binding protein